MGGSAGLAGGGTAGSAGSGPGSVRPNGSGGFVVDAGYLRVGVNSAGVVTSLVDSRTALDYIATGEHTAPLVSLIVDAKQVKPTSVSLGASNTLVFSGPNGYEVHVAVQDETTYTTLAVTKVTGPSDGKLQTLLWGPIPTNIKQTVGEAVGIVRDGSFAIGMQVLNDLTQGGWPLENSTLGWANQLELGTDWSGFKPITPGQDFMWEWCVGAHTTWGSVLRAYSRNYTERQVVTVDQSYTGSPTYPMPVGPLPGAEGSIVGSKIALFGTIPDMALTVLSQIAKGEDLPYPTINGQWQKAAQDASESDLILRDLNTGSLDQAITFAKAAGLRIVYSFVGVGGPWRTNGHYEFNGDFGGSDSAATAMVARARAQGIKLGTHTLSDFVDPSDSYVSPTPSPDLATGVSATLSQPLSAGDTTAYLSSCEPLASGPIGQMLLIGSEIVSYKASQDNCMVTGLSRGAWGTKAAAHSSGANVARVPENEYNGALGGINIVKNIATRFATIFNTTGISAMSFDGLEAASAAGWSSYGIAVNVNETYRQLKQTDGFIIEASVLSSNTWNAISRTNWGEYFSAVNLEQLFQRDAFYAANYFPHTKGWIGTDANQSVQSAEKFLAIGAGLNSGAAYDTSVGNLSGGSNTAALLEAIKQWETARSLGAFTADQRALLKDPSLHWHLTVATPGKSWSLQQLDGQGNPMGAAQPVNAPTPAFTTTALPDMTVGSLYEARVTTNNPQTIRYSVTSGALPGGLTLNPDTGGITGIPASGATATFTITAKGGAGTADAQAAFTIK